MTASKKTVRTRRGVEPTGRPARREVELGKKSTNELVQDVRAESWSAALESIIFGRPRLDQHRRRAVVVVDVHGVGLGLGWFLEPASESVKRP